MSESVEGVDGISQAFWMKMENSPLFVQNPADSPANNAARESLRAEFLPMALFLEQHGELPADAEPETILTSVIDSPNLALDEAQKSSLKPFVPDIQPGERRDWLKETIDMSLRADHPIRQLRGKTVSKLLPPAQLRLSMS